MRNPRLRLVMITVVAVAFAFAVLMALRPRKPGLAGEIESLVATPDTRLYQGRTLAEWLAEMNDFNLPKGMAEAMKFYGSNAVPELVAMIGARDSALKEKLMEWNSRQKRVHLHLTRAYEYRWRAELAIQFIRQDAGPGVPRLAELLADPDPGVRASAAVALGMLETVAEPAVPDLVKCLSDPDARVRATSAGTLGRVGRRPATVVPALIKALKDSDPQVRAEAAGNLAAFGDAASTAVPGLVAAHSDANADVRRRAGNALKYLDPDAAVRAGVK